jgi:hypothetical protein
VSEEELDTLLAALDHGLELADQEAAKGVGSGAPA